MFRTIFAFLILQCRYGWKSHQEAPAAPPAPPAPPAPAPADVPAESVAPPAAAPAENELGAEAAEDQRSDPGIQFCQSKVCNTDPV